MSPEDSLCVSPLLRKPHPNNPSIYILITCFNLCKANLTLIVANRRGDLILLYLKKIVSVCHNWVISELTQTTPREEEDGKTRVCNKRDCAITCESCRNLHLKLMFSGLYEKTRLKATSPRLLINHDTSLPSFKLNFLKTSRSWNLKHPFQISDVTAAIMKRWPCWCMKIILQGANCILMWLTFLLFFCSINRPGSLLIFWTLKAGAYSRWALIRGWALNIYSKWSMLILQQNSKCE